MSSNSFESTLVKAGYTALTSVEAIGPYDALNIEPRVDFYVQLLVLRYLAQLVLQ